MKQPLIMNENDELHLDNSVSFHFCQPDCFLGSFNCTLHLSTVAQDGLPCVGFNTLSITI